MVDVFGVFKMVYEVLLIIFKSIQKLYDKCELELVD